MLLEHTTLSLWATLSIIIPSKIKLVSRYYLFTLQLKDEVSVLQQNLAFLNKPFYKIWSRLKLINICLKISLASSLYKTNWKTVPDVNDLKSRGIWTSNRRSQWVIAGLQGLSNPNICNSKCSQTIWILAWYQDWKVLHYNAMCVRNKVNFILD